MLCYYITSFAFKNTPGCSIKYFKTSDVIVIKKKSLFKVFIVSVILMFKLVLKKDKMVCCRPHGGTNRASKNSDIITLVTIIIMLW